MKIIRSEKVKVSLTVINIAFVGITYLPWSECLLSIAPPDKIIAWYPHLGIFWLCIRAFIQPILLIACIINIIDLSLPWLKVFPGYLRERIREVFWDYRGWQ
jgi:hypothetical protein